MAFDGQKRLLDQDSVSSTIPDNIFYNVEALQTWAIQKTVSAICTLLGGIGTRLGWVTLIRKPYNEEGEPATVP